MTFLSSIRKDHSSSFANQICLLLALANLLYCGKQFYVSAWKQLLHHTANMEVVGLLGFTSLTPTIIISISRGRIITVHIAVGIIVRCILSQFVGQKELHGIRIVVDVHECPVRQ